MKFRERKHMFIKYHISGYINSVGFNFKTFVSLVKRAITKENTLGGAKSKLLGVVGPKVQQQAHTIILREE
jgi:hypothetical protein